jgi:hypothetical protein
MIVIYIVLELVGKSDHACKIKKDIAILTRETGVGIRAALTSSRTGKALTEVT